MPTASDLIESAALKLGAKATGEALTADEATDSLSVLNSMLDNFSTNELLVYQIVQDSYTWASGSSSRTIGSGGSLNGTRPKRIESIYFRDSSNYDYPVKVWRDRIAYDSVADKTIQSTLPEFVFYDTAFPLGVLYAYPVPSASLTVKISHWQILQSFAALTTDLALPPGYQWMIEHNLAEALQPLFAMQAPPYVIKEAALSKKRLMRINRIPRVSSTELAGVLGGGRGYNIKTDG